MASCLWSGQLEGSRGIDGVLSLEAFRFNGAYCAYWTRVFQTTTLLTSQPQILSMTELSGICQVVRLKIIGKVSANGNADQYS